MGPQHPLLASALWIPLTLTTVWPSLQAQVFVRSNAAGANDGSSWADAYTSLRAALENTASGEIWVARGTYRPVNCDPCTEADKEATFNLPPGVQLFGGFAGSETVRSQRDYKMASMILSFLIL